MTWIHTKTLFQKLCLSRLTFFRSTVNLSFLFFLMLPRFDFLSLSYPNGICFPFNSQHAFSIWHQPDRFSFTIDFFFLFHSCSSCFLILPRSFSRAFSSVSFYLSLYNFPLFTLQVSLHVVSLTENFFLEHVSSLPPVEVEILCVSTRECRVCKKKQKKKHGEREREREREREYPHNKKIIITSNNW